jgi:hypothetical protein
VDIRLVACVLGLVVVVLQCAVMVVISVLDGRLVEGSLLQGGVGYQPAREVGGDFYDLFELEDAAGCSIRSSTS